MLEGEDPGKGVPLLSRCCSHCTRGLFALHGRDAPQTICTRKHGERICVLNQNKEMAVNVPEEIDVPYSLE